MLCSKLHLKASRFRAIFSKESAAKLTSVALSIALPIALVTSLALSIGCTKKVDDKDTTINAVLRANVKGLDPLRANDQYSATVIAQMYEGLLQYHYLKRPFELVPALAESMPTVSDNGLTHTFKIKKGVRFHDNPAFKDGKGREVTAEDFIYSFKRLADPRNASEGFWIFDGKIKGLNEWQTAVKGEKANYDTPVEGLQAPDAHTLVIKLTQPYYQLYYVLAMQFSSVVAREAVEKYGQEFLNNPVGTGPFMLEKSSDWVRNSKITLKKNPTWRGETFPSEGESGDKEKGLLADAGKSLPFAEKLVFTELTEDQPRWQNLMKGNFEFTEVPNDNFESAVNKSNRKEIAAELAGKGMRLDITSAPDVAYIGFNMKDPLLGKNKTLRQAMSMAQDSQTLIDKFMNGRGLAAQGPVPPGLGSYDASFKNVNAQFNVAKAKEMLAKAGFPEGKGLPELTYEGLADSKARQQAEFFAQKMAAIGVKVKISANTWPQFQEKIKNGQAQLFGIAWGADYPDAQNFYQLFYSKNMSPGPNDTAFSNAEFDKLYEESLRLPPGNARDALYTKMRDIVTEETPWIFNAHRTRYTIIHGWLNNFKWNDIQNDYFKYLRVDAKKRAELKAKL
jgi:oligopeptide transport system substrate-binding protein